MFSTNALSDLLAALYSTPLHPENWKSFLDRLSGLTRFSNGFLLTIGANRTPVALAAGGFGFNSEIIVQYGQGYAEIDPFGPPVLRNLGVAVIRGDCLVSRDELHKTEIYNGLLRKNEMESMVVLTFNRVDEGGDFISMWHRAKEGPMAETSIAILQMLLPHVHTTLKLRSALETAEIRGYFAELTLESISLAAFLVSASSKVLQMNKKAATLVQKADGLYLKRTHLAVRHSVEDEQLRLLIRCAALTGSRLSHVPGGACLVSRQKSHRPLQVTVLPSKGTFQFVGREPCVLVLANDPLAVPPSRASILRDLYRLTPAEARLADLLLTGLSVHETAERMNITLGTARFQLKRVLAKTDTHRQAELVRLMLSLPGCG